MNPQAQAINAVLQKEAPAIYSLLSQGGREIFFPRKGILMQSRDAAGQKINASIGMAAQEDGSPLHIEALAKLIGLAPDKIFPYAPSYGIRALRERWQALLEEKNPSLRGQDRTLPVVTNALTHGLSLCGYLFLDEGEKIILPEYFWGNYNLVFGNARGARLDSYPLYSAGGFNLAGLEAKIGEPGEKKVLLLNFPNNPTGYTPLIEEVRQIRKILLKAAQGGKKLVVLCDDAYFGLVFEKGVFGESIFAVLAGLHENILAVKVDGATKEDYAWGFRVGFLTYAWKGMTPEAGEVLVEKTAGALRGNISSVSVLTQNLLLAAYEEEGYRQDKQKKFDLLQKRYELVKKTLAAHPEYTEYFRALPYNSGYFMCVELQKGEAEELRQKLLADYETGVIALGRLVRVAFSSLPSHQIEELFENIYQACRELV